MIRGSRTTGTRRRAAPLVASGVAALATVVVSGGVWAGPARAAGPPVSGRVAVAGAGTLPAGATVVGATPSDATVSADVALQPRDPAALAAFARAVSTPGSPTYGQYLAKGQFATRFGPLPPTIAAVRAWLASDGLSVGPTSANGLLVPVTGSAARVEAALTVGLRQVRLADGSPARTTEGSPTVPAALGGAVQGVVGLSSTARLRPQLVRASTAVPTTAPTTVPAATAPATGAPGPGPAPAAQAAPHTAGPTACAAAYGPDRYTADQLAQAYGFSTLYGQGRTGAGQSVGIFELEPFTPADIAAYQACYGTHVPVTTVPVDGGASGPQSGEAALDIETVAGLAPGASVIVYSGPGDASGTGAIDTYARMVDDDAARVLTTSWGLCEPEVSPQIRSTETTLFAQAQAQGQTILAASGDAGSSDCYAPQFGVYDKSLQVDDPADHPDVTGVGGTSLPKAGTTVGETTWNTGPSSRPGAGGGGVSTSFPGRQVPDVSANANANHGTAIYFDGYWQSIGGTSAGSPLWAALVADAGQGCATPVGMMNGKLAAAGAGPSPPFHDITTGTNILAVDPPQTVYAAGPGYDMATGWGSPEAGALVGTLTGAAQGCPSLTGLSTGSGPAVGGTRVTISGDGFGTATGTVHFGSAAATVTSWSPTSVTVTTPDVGTGQVVAVTVTSTTSPGAGTSPAVGAGTFTFLSPQVSAVVPNRGAPAGGTRITVEGSGFTGATSVTVGGRGVPFSVTSDTTITATVPPGPAGGGTVDVVVAAPDGHSPTVAGDQYHYVPTGYRLTASDGGIFSFGHSAFYGSTGGLALVRPVVGMAATPDDKGYWLVASDGGIFAFGDAPFYGSTGNVVLNEPIVGMAPTPDGRGYWLVASDGGIFAFGDAAFYGSTGAIALHRPIVGMAATPDGRGYWLVASDGGIFAFGDAAFSGSTGAIALNRPIVGMAPTVDGNGYWLVASDGGIFAFGDAAFYGSTGAIALNRPIVGMAATVDGRGYWLVASDGGIFSFGDAVFQGSTGGLVLNRPVVGMTGA